MEKYILLGGGGFAIELYQYMKSDGKEIMGYMSLEEDGQLDRYIPWLGFEGTKSEDELDNEAYYIIAVRSLKLRRKLMSFIEGHKLKAGSFVHSSVFLSDMATLGKGLVAFPRAMITGNPIVGEYLFIDSLAIISHGDVIGDNVVIGPAAVITGDCTIGDNVTFGANSAILPGTKIGNNVEIAINTYPGRRVADESSIISPPGKRFGKGLNKSF